MILVDTSVWVDHLSIGDRRLAGLLDDRRVLTHPFVIGELALGNLKQRDLILGYLHDLPVAGLASDPEVLHFIDQHALYGSGIGYIDAHLLAAVALTHGAALWTRDKRLRAAAQSLSLLAPLG